MEVILLACTGYSTSQELVLLRNETFQYQPDLVLWCYVLNDPADPLTKIRLETLAHGAQSMLRIADFSKLG